MFEVSVDCTITIFFITFYLICVSSKKSILFAFLALFLCAYSGFAQKFDRITLDRGLSQSHINCIKQDKTGFIWFGTNGGLNRFDGSEFKIFLHDIYDSTSISNNIINCIFEDKNGLLWIGTQNGLNVYDPTRDKFEIFKTNVNNPKSLSSNIITSVVQDTLGYYWIGTNGGGLNRYDTLSKSFTVYQYNIQNPYSVSSNRISSLAVDMFGFIWVGTYDEGVNMMDPISGKCLRYVKSEDNEKIISDNQVNTIYEDNDGDLWIGTGNGLNKFTPQKNGRNFESRDFVYQYLFEPKRNSIGGKSILSIYQGASGLLWIGTDNGGLSSFNKSAEYFKNYQFDPNNQNGLLGNKITAVLDDRSEILWIGTNAGINKIDRQGERFELHTRKPGKENTWSSNNVQAIYKENNGILWVGTFDGGLNKYNPSTGQYTIYLEDDVIEGGMSLEEHRKILNKNRKKSRRYDDKRSHLSNNRILALHRDFSRTLWIGTGGGGLNKLDVVNGKIIVYRAKKENPDSLSSDVINTIFQDSSGKLWIGTDGGLHEFDYKKFTRYVHDQNDVLSLSSNNVTSITEDKEGNIWVGTFGGGLNKLDRKSGFFKRYTNQEFNKGISSNSIYCLFLDESSRLWIGTNDGLNMLNTENDSIYHYTIHNNLPSNFIYGIIGDDENNLWISTNKGISKFNIREELSKNYDRLDGLQGNEFNPGAFYKTRRGEMLFGGINGFNSFFPKNIKDNNYKPDVILTDFKILGEPVKIGTEKSPLPRHISELKEIHLSYKDKAISFEFVALNYTNSEKNEYAYILEGFEKKWNFVGNRRFANYTNLPPGDYTFRVKASNNDGIWNDEGVSLRIFISPPFYKTWWFYLLVFVSILIGAYLFVVIRINNLQKTKTLLREVVKARTKQLSEEKARVEKAHAEIMWQKNEIENQKNLLMKNNRDLLDAKQQIDAANEELKTINSNLESIVLERTEKLRAAYENLIKANNELDLFIYRASHDLKGPIASLLGLTKIAKLDDLPDNTANYIDKIELGAEQLNNVLNKLTDIHFINKSELELSDILVADFIDEIVNKINPYKKSRYTVVNKIKKGLTINGDEKLIQIIFSNIIENALTFKQPIESKLIIKEFTDDKTLKIVFEDNGIGIPKENQHKIFDMFYRASDLSEGSGLGLYLVKKAAEKLNGLIYLESERGQYSKFTVQFPVEYVIKNSQKKSNKKANIAI